MDPRLRLAGLLFLVPFALIALLWVGLGTPWDATPAQNEMRYAVLLAGAISVTTAFFVLHEALRDAGERLFSSLGIATGFLSGAAFVVWTAFQLGYYAMAVAKGTVPTDLTLINDVFDGLLFAAGALAYVTTGAFAHAAGRLKWLGPTASFAYVVLNALALGLLLIRGVTFPNPHASPESWYIRPGFVVGIPAMPWVMPFFLGVVLLKRFGNRQP